MNRRFSITICSIVGLGLLLLLVAVPVGFAREPVPSYDPQGYVSDHAGVIDAEWRARIRSVCQDLERKTGVEMVVVTVPTLKPYGSANDYAVGLYQKWGIGSAQNEHGVLVLLSVQERQAAVTMGRRMLPVMGGMWSGRSGMNISTPPSRTATSAKDSIEPSWGWRRSRRRFASAPLRRRTFADSGSGSRSLPSGSSLVSLVAQPPGSPPSLWAPAARRILGERPRGFGGNFGGHGGGMSGEGWK